MSEKGQGEESTTGTATGIDGGATGAAAGGSGSQADQTGPADDPLGGLTPRDFPPAPASEEPAQAEPDIPGGGPVDTRPGWDYPEGQEGTRGDPPEAQAPPQETDAERQARQDLAEEQHRRAYSDAMRRRDQQRASEEGPQVDPPPLDDSTGSDPGDENPTGSYLGDDEKPVLS